MKFFSKAAQRSDLLKSQDYSVLDKTTAYRLLSTLEKRGYVERSSQNRKYRIGLRAFELGAYYQNQLEVRKIGLAYLHEIVRQSNEDAFLCIREEDFALCIEKVDGESQVNIYALRVGGKQPLHCGGAPRALLVGMDDEELSEYASRTGLIPATPYTIKTLNDLLEDARCTRQQGYTVSNNDATIGIAAVGAPVYDRFGRVTASISLSGLAYRYQGDRLADFTRLILDISSRFSRQMGFTTENIQQESSLLERGKV